jgi:putative nucleotidyltransferase with HDIG domain
LPFKQARTQADKTRNQVTGGNALAGRPSRFVVALELAGLAGAIALAIFTNGDANWDLPLLAVLLTLSIVSDVAAVETHGQVKISGSFLSLVLAMVFLGGPPAALVGAATIVVGWLRWRDDWHFFINNLTAYVIFPLVSGIAFRAVTEASGLGTSDGFFYLLVCGVFGFSLAINFLIVAGYTAYFERRTLLQMVRKLVIPVWSSELAAALLAVGIAYLYVHVGLAAIALFGIVLFTFQYLLGELLKSEHRAEELQQRTRQLASLQVGLLSALLHTLDLRDRMTARHSAAVARYSKEIARAAGFSEQEQDLVHTAALLHDVGKFIFPDRILKGDHKLTDDDWNIIRMHPYQGARIVSQIEGYGPVGEIIIAHHERIDGKGYPRRLKGDEIPELSRIISVADIYDVMTARDSYREPISSFEAITELRRVSGTQVDGRFVEVFTQVLAGKDVRYRHGEAADFDAELALEKRVHDYAALGLNGHSSEGEGAEEPPDDAADVEEASVVAIAQTRAATGAVSGGDDPASA